MAGWGYKLADLLLKMYSGGLLGGLPAEESKARTGLYKTKTGELEELGKLGKKPVWTTLTPGMEYQPAAEKLLPGQQKIEAGGKAYRAPAGKPRAEMVGKTYGELGALGGIVKDLPISQLITAKAGPEMMKPWLGKVMPPGAVTGMTGGAMFPTEGLRGLEQYMGVMEELKKAEGVLPEQKKGLEDIAATLFGITEKRKRPTITMAKPGETPIITRGERIGERLPQVPPKEEKPKMEAGYAAWKEDHPEGTYIDYKKAMRGVQLIEAPPSIEDLDKKVQEWVKVEKSLVAGGMDDPTMQMLMASLPADDPFKQAFQKQDFEALEQEARTHREYYQELLHEAKIKKEYPNAKKDEYGNWVVTIDGKEYVVTP